MSYFETLQTEKAARRARIAAAGRADFDHEIVVHRRPVTKAPHVIAKLPPLPSPPIDPKPLVTLPNNSIRRMPLNVIMIQTAVCDHFGISRVTMLSKSQRRIIARPRQVAMFLVREFCPHLSTPIIGKHFGGRDHTTTLHGVNTIKRLTETNAEMAEAVDTLRVRLARVKLTRLQDATP